MSENGNGALPRLPAGWEWKKLGALGDYINGRAFKESDWGSVGKPIIRIQNLTDPSKSYNYFDGRVEERYKVSSGDLLVSWAATLDVFEWQSEDAVLNQHIFKVDSNLDQRFHYWLLKYALPRLRQQAHGSGMVHITRKKFDSTLVPVPGREEQRRVRARIDEVVSSVEAGKRNIQSSLDSIRLWERSRATQLLASDIDSRSRLDSLGEVFVGATPSRKDQSLWDGKVPWVSSGEVAFVPVTTTRETISRAGLGDPVRRLQPAGSVLIAMYGEGKTRGQSALLEIDAATNQAVATVRVDPDKALSEFVFLCLWQQYEAIREIGSGTQQKNLSKGLVRAIEIPRPPLSHQERAVKGVRGLRAEAARMREELISRLTAADQLQTALLEHAFMGKL